MLTQTRAGRPPQRHFRYGAIAGIAAFWVATAAHTRDKALIFRDNFPRMNVWAGGARAAYMLTAQLANIFNGVFETQKSAQNATKNAKMRAKKHSRFRVYHAGINHDAATCQLHGILGNALSRNHRPRGMSTLFYHPYRLLRVCIV